MIYPLIAAPFFTVDCPYRFLFGLLILGSADWSVLRPPDLGGPPRPPPLDMRLAPDESPRRFGDVASLPLRDLDRWLCANVIGAKLGPNSVLISLYCFLFDFDPLLPG